MDKISSKFAELQKLVIKEILKGNFEEETRNAHHVQIKVGELSFNIWIANGVEYVGTYEYLHNDIALKFTQEEKERIYDLLKVGECEKITLGKFANNLDEK